ncbi:MAG TPA: hypothetical protein VFN19_00360 [Candidatus Nanopelagicales bacterium]|jgi:hypothetical protein|nr:hypothetical protein [Candidatus Nanopelagicales bacterium]
MTSSRRIALAGSVMVTLALLSGCSSSSTAESSPGGTAPAGPAPQAVPSGDTTSAPSDDNSPTSNVMNSQGLTTWLAAVCTASQKTLLADSLAVDPSAIAKDPQKAAAKLADGYQSLSTRLRGFADQLEQIGAPDVPNGKEFTDGYVDAARSLADAYGAVSLNLPSNPSPQEVLAQLQQVQTPKLRATVKRFEALSKLLDTQEIEKAAESVPECKKINFNQ